MSADPNNDGGPAFPRDHRSDGHNGMSLRDYFAAHAPAMPGTFMSGLIDGEFLSDEVRLIAWRWHYADEMLKARQS